MNEKLISKEIFEIKDERAQEIMMELEKSINEEINSKSKISLNYRICKRTYEEFSHSSKNELYFVFYMVGIGVNALQQNK